MVTLFWIVCLAAGGVHPLLVFSYIRLLKKRKDSIETLYDQVRGQRTGQTQGRSLGGVLREVAKNESTGLGYVIPCVICSALSIAGAIVITQLSGVADPFGFPASFAEFLKKANHTAVLGFAGAFLASVYGIVDRFRSLTLSPFLLHLAWFRLAFGAVLGAVITDFVTAGLAAAGALAMGFLPIRELLESLRNVARRAFGSDKTNPVPEEASWSLIQGATPDIVERLDEADVTSIASLASQNPLALMKRTNIHWRALLDLMDQAILVTYVADKISSLRGIGVRGAIEAGILHRRIALTPPDAHAAETLRKMADVLGNGLDSAHNLVRNLSEDAQVNLLHELWFEEDADQPQRAAGELSEEEIRRQLASPRDTTLTDMR